MSQFPDARFDPYGEQVPLERRTSGLAVTALVLSLIGAVPCCGAITAPIGVILGAIGTVTIGRNPAVKGRGLALAAVVIGVILTAAQVGGYILLYRTMWQPVIDGPTQALHAANAGNVTEFKRQFFGAGATASDEQARQFIDTLRSRYGNFVNATLDEQRTSQPQFGQPQAEFPYLIQFERQSVSADAEIVFADPSGQQGIVMKLGYITILDPVQGDLTYPPAQAAAPTSPSPSPRRDQPSSTDTAAPDDQPGDDSPAASDVSDDER